MVEAKEGHEMHALGRQLFPVCRSITGDGVRETLKQISSHLPVTLNFKEVPSGAQVFDWTVPKEWNIRAAWIEGPSGERVVDFDDNNLHVVGYSVPVDRRISLTELQGHLYSLEEQPDAIPYVTSYYEERWGFCMTHEQRAMLPQGEYRVFVDSDLKDGSLTYGEWVLPGELDEEILISTYVCHPSMANNELSGPLVATWIGRWLAKETRRYTYRFIYIPETIGAIAYLSEKHEHLRSHVRAGFNLSCVGDERAYTMISTRYANTISDRVSSNVLRSIDPDFNHYSFLQRGSDERQFCSPGVDLPMVTLCRTRFGDFPEYHTSKDNLEFVTAEGLQGGFDMVKACLEALEHNAVFKVTCLGEPQLGKRNLRSNLLSDTQSYSSARAMMDLIAYADGTNDLIEISNIIGCPVSELYPIAARLVEAKVLERL